MTSGMRWWEGHGSLESVVGHRAKGPKALIGSPVTLREAVEARSPMVQAGVLTHQEWVRMAFEGTARMDEARRLANLKEMGS